MNGVRQVVQGYVSNPVAHLKRYLTMPNSDRGEELATEHLYVYEAWLKYEYGDIEEMRIEGLDEGPIMTEFYDSGEWRQDIDSADWPTWAHMEYSKVLKNQWAVHFTHDANSIADSGFRGIEDVSRLGLTYQTHESQKHKGGYNFAYPAENIPNDAEKYGTEVVMFRASGVLVWHDGDQEYQAIFAGNTAKDFVTIYQDGDNGEWTIGERDSGGPIYQNDSIQKMVDWIMKHWRQYHKAIAY